MLANDRLYRMITYMQRVPLFIAVLLLGLVQFAPAALTCCLTPACTAQISISSEHTACCAAHVTTQVEPSPCHLAPLANGEKFLLAQTTSINDAHSDVMYCWVYARTLLPTARDALLVTTRAGPYVDQPPASAQMLQIKRSTQLLI